MADWEADSPKLQSNLEIVFGWIAAWATDREHLDAELLKRWHQQTMEGLSIPDPSFETLARNPEHRGVDA